MQQRIKLSHLLIGVLLFAFSIQVKADCTWSTSGAGCAFQVQATIQNGCSVTGGTGTPVFGTLDFGTYPSLSTATATASLIGSAVFHLNCTPNMTLNMSIDGGQHYLAGRRMQKSSRYLLYQLYSDATMQTPIGLSQPVGIAIGTNNNNVVLPVYGRLILPGIAEAGTYTDVLVVTLSW